MPPGYNSQQKQAITQFQTITETDKNSAIKELKRHGWNLDEAIAQYFGSTGGGAAPSSWKAPIGKIFDKYREDPANSPDTINLDGTMKFFGDIDVNLEGLDFIIVSELIKAPAIGEISRAGFVDGWLSARCDTVDKMKNHVKTLKKSLPSDTEAYTQVYQYTFQLAKSGNQKTLPLDDACTYWDVVFNSPLSAVKWRSANTPWVDWWFEFLRAEYKRAINKDVWVQTLKFAQETLKDENLSFWNEEASWPSVIDDFVEWVKKEKRGGGATAEAMEE